MFQFFPWSNAHQLNLDWILEFIKHLPWTVNGKEPDPETHNINLAGWEGGVLEIPDGGTGMSGIYTTGTLANFIDSEADSDHITISSGRVTSWGQVVEIGLRFKKDTGLSGDTIIATINNSYRPQFQILLPAMSPDYMGYGAIGSNGEIHYYGTVPADTYIAIHGTYLRK